MLTKPSGEVFEAFKRYFETEEDGKILIGHDAKTVHLPDDLIALLPGPDEDRLSKLIGFVCGRCLQVNPIVLSNQSSSNSGQERKRKRSQHHSDIYYYPSRRVQILSYTLSAIFCAILLVGAMACLGAINQRSWQLRIGMVALFTFLFAAFVALLTKARRAEVFGATAAYAAVLVVYVSTGIGSAAKQASVR
jgi:hypothetical protein